MERIFELGEKKYTAAAQPEKSNLFEMCVILFGTFIDVLKVSILSIPYLIESFVYLFIPRRKKSIAEQVALVYPTKNILSVIEIICMCVTFVILQK